MDRLNRNAPELLLGLALVASVALVLVLTRHFTFLQDSWEFLMNRRELTVDALLKPHNEHIVVIPVAIEQLLLRLFGMGSARPEYVLLALALAATALLLYVYVRRRVGPWLALAAAVLLLFLGPAWEALLWPFEISFVGSVLFGIAMLLALDREDRKGDIAACVLLVLCFGFSSLGIPFAVAAAVDVFQKRGSRGLGRACLVAVPVLLYGAWYLGWGHEAETHVSLRNVLVLAALRLRSGRRRDRFALRPRHHSLRRLHRPDLGAGDPRRPGRRLRLPAGAPSGRRAGLLAGRRGGGDQLAPHRLQPDPRPRPHLQPLPVHGRGARADAAREPAPRGALRPQGADRRGGGGRRCGGGQRRGPRRRTGISSKRSRC